MDCVVLSLQHSSVFYPSCKGCFSRVDVEQRDTTRCRCSRCGYLCQREEIGYRYRLSLRVIGGKHIFGVTVFGSNLNQFFGIDATGLQRLVENTDGPLEPSRKFTLLLKAIEDCFIGRHFIFGMKLTEGDRRPWIEDSVPNCSSSKDFAQLIATQMILPKATGLEGCAVVTYYQKLLQKALDSRLSPSQLLLTPHHSPASSFNATLSSPHRLSQSLHRSQLPDGTLTPTPPWRQSLGVVTSSAEQEESVSSQTHGDKNSRRTDNSGMLHWVGRHCLQKHETSDKGTSHAKCPNSPSKKSVRTGPILNASFALSQADPKRRSDEVAEFSTEELTRTLLSSSVDWEDLPFSESLTAFICGENKEFDIAFDTETNTNVLCQKNVTRNNVGTTNRTTEATSTGQRNAHPTENHSQLLLNDIDIENGHRLKMADQSYKDFSQQDNQSEARSIRSSRFDEQNELKISFESEEQDFIEDTYNCSADLFGSSSLVGPKTETLSCKVETVRTPTEVCTLSLRPDQTHLMQSPRENRGPDRRSYNRDSLTMQDFVPSSQSTPNVKGFMSHSFKSPHRMSTHVFSSQPDRQDPEALIENMCDLSPKKPVNGTSVPPQLNGPVSTDQLLQCGKVCAKENATWSTTPSRCSYKPTTGRRLRKPDEHKNPLPTRRHFKVQGRSKALRLSGAISNKRDSRVFRVSACDNDSSDVLIPPTPARKVRPLTQQPHSCSRRLDSSTDQQRRAADDPEITVKSSHREEGPTRCVADGGSLDLANDYLPVDESRTCDWSRDLFSESDLM